MAGLATETRRVLLSPCLGNPKHIIGMNGNCRDAKRTDMDGQTKFPNLSAILT